MHPDPVQPASPQAVPQPPAGPVFVPGPYGPPPGFGPLGPPRPARPPSGWRQPWVLVVVGVITTVVLCGGLVLAGAVSDRAGLDDMDVTITSCEFSGGEILPSATVGYTVTNRGSSARSVTLRIEYRDGSGARIDTDTAYVRDVRPGDTVRGEEITLLDVPVAAGKCTLAGVS